MNILLPSSIDVIVELGSGDGKLLKNLLKQNEDNFLIGIEIDPDLYSKEFSILPKNVKLINDSFEDILPRLPDNSISKFISMLPDPKYIDKTHQILWTRLYQILYDKLIPKGIFLLVTEITDELLQPVSDNLFNKEVQNIQQVFQSIGFDVLNKYEGGPKDLSSSFLKKFQEDNTQRIRIITFEFIKN
ncbi:MAG: hypothetical protein ACPKPY_08450 [Nitrososphaeraceae archaeon]